MRAIAMNHFCKGKCESWNSVPVVALKCKPHSEHSYFRYGRPVLPVVSMR